jgi:hypothetical protein
MLAYVLRARFVEKSQRESQNRKQGSTPMRLTKTRPALLCAASLAVMSFTLVGPTFAASVCKGMPQESCETTENCRWQAGYTRKDAVEVSSHCRSSGKKQEVVPEASAGSDAEKAS